MNWWFFFPLSGRYFLFLPGPQISIPDTDLSSVQRGTLLLCAKAETPGLSSSFSSQWLAPSTTIQWPESKPGCQLFCLSSLTQLIGTSSCVFLHHRYLILLLLHVHSCHPNACHHHFLPLITSYTPTSTLVWSNPFHSPQYRWGNLSKMSFQLFIFPALNPTMVSHFHIPPQDIVLNKRPANFSKFIPHHSKVPSSCPCHPLISTPYPIGFSQQLFECT